MSALPSASLRVRWAAIGAAIAVAIGGGALSVVHSIGSDGDQAVFVPITPCRLFDTRADQHVGNRIAPIAASETFTQQVRGANGNCTIPDDAVGVAMNATVVNGSAASFLTIWPTDAPRPLASSLNWIAGAAPTPNKVDVKLSGTGAISLYNNTGTVDILADVVGYYATFDNPTVRMSVNPRTMVVVVGFTSQADITTVNNCAKVFEGSASRVPLDLPIGARLSSVDISFYDGSTSEVYKAFVEEHSPVAAGLSERIVSSTEGGAGSGSIALVQHHLTFTEPTTVDEGETFAITFDGLVNNGVCSITVEYDPAP
ncbi:MAG TPA: hypothetical protein VHN36_08310 [Ilumatobacteraceae bacterium]|nr:hypothetical protein [Ilumatobacteraceae bacterium]